VATSVKSTPGTKKPGIAKAIRAARVSSLAEFLERPQAEQIGAETEL
jgi:hypothetical protein